MTGCECSVSVYLGEDRGEEGALANLKAKCRSCLRAGLLSFPVLSPYEGEVIADISLGSYVERNDISAVLLCHRLRLHHFILS